MSDADEVSGWVVEPPSSDAAMIAVDFSQEGGLTPEVLDALEALATAVQDATAAPSTDVSGFAYGMPSICSDNNVCAPESSAPCVRRLIITCTIKPCPTFAIGQ